MKLKKYITTALALIIIGTSMSNTVSAMGVNNSVDLIGFENTLEEMESYEITEYDDDAKIEGLNMSYNDMRVLYDEFSAQNVKNINNEDGYDDTQDFVNYAVYVGAIKPFSVKVLINDTL